MTDELYFENIVDDRTLKIAVLGMGYVGLPLALGFVSAGYSVLGYDVDAQQVARINTGSSNLLSVKNEDISNAVSGGRLKATSLEKDLEGIDVFILCVPTPVLGQKQPDLSYVEQSSRLVSSYVKKGTLCILESTTFPGTTDEYLVNWLESQSSLKANEDFYVAYSPEREDPGNKDFSIKNIPKVVGSDTSCGLQRSVYLYKSMIDEVIPVSSTRVAEAVKITENVFRATNIALVNELKLIYDKMDINVWEVLDAASTKPFGFMKFSPGPGIGGHCIPVDPYYLTWKAKEFGVHTRFIELAGEINEGMSGYVIGKLERALGEKRLKPLFRSKVLMLGVAYKPELADLRESPGLDIAEALIERGVCLDYHDPYIPEIPETRKHPKLSGLESVSVDEVSLSKYDACLIITGHKSIDWELVAKKGGLIVDTRNVLGGFPSANVVLA